MIAEYIRKKGIVRPSFDGRRVVIDNAQQVVNRRSRAQQRLEARIF